MLGRYGIYVCNFAEATDPSGLTTVSPEPLVSGVSGTSLLSFRIKDFKLEIRFKLLSDFFFRRVPFALVLVGEPTGVGQGVLSIEGTVVDSAETK